jgi:putative nucleotidyltransferase with HDIG domain
MADHTSLVEIIHEHLASDQLHLPVFPPLALQLQDILAQDNCNIQQVAAKIMEDQALASHLLRVANSAFFTGLSKVSTIKDAIVRLGVKQVTSIVMLVTQQQQYRSRHKMFTAYIESLWKHAVSCAMGTKWLAEKSGYRSLTQEAFLAGLLHDIGKLFLLKVLEDIHASGEYNINLSKAIVGEVLESMHAEQGARLLQQWNIPELYCDVARDHHKEDYDPNNTVLTMVRLVNLACHKLGFGLQHDASLVLAAMAEAQTLEISELLLAELEIILEDAIALAR